MDISLEKIDQVRDRTGVSYKEAKEALEAVDGNVVDAIILIEEKQQSKWFDNITEGISGTGNEILEKIKKVIKKGNVTKILLKRDDEVIMNIPITAGAVGAILSPHIAMLGVLAALATKCKIEIVKTDGEIVDINEIAEDTLENVKNKAEEVRSKVKTYADKVSMMKSKKTDESEDEEEDTNHSADE